MRGSMARTGALLFGAAFLLFGVLRLFVHNGMGMEADNETTGKLLGLFPVNLLHNIVHLAFGVWGIVASAAMPHRAATAASAPRSTPCWW